MATIAFKGTTKLHDLIGAYENIKTHRENNKMNGRGGKEEKLFFRLGL